MPILQELLNLGLVDIGSDDTRFEKMQSAASALAKRFSDNPKLLITATLIALDEEIDEDDPFFDLVEELVINEWNTLRNTHVNRPRQLLRSIAIDSLASTIDSGPEACGVMWNVAAARLRHKQARLGKAAALVESLLHHAFEKAETAALQHAAITPSPVRRRKEKKSPLFTGEIQPAAKIEEDELLQDVARAVGPNNAQGKELSDSNPNWPNTGEPWANEFTSRMTAALAKAVNLGMSRLAESLANNLVAHVATLEQHLFDELKAIEALQAEMEQARSSTPMRLDVLWWSQARFSPSQKRGYGDLSAAVAAFVAAIDLTAIVPPLAPASVTYVLGETVSGFCAKNNLSMPIAEYLKEISESSLDLGDALPRATNEVRVTLLELAIKATGGSIVSADAIRSRVGVDNELALTPADFSMWLFQELQARRIIEELL